MTRSLVAVVLLLALVACNSPDLTPPPISPVQDTPALGSPPPYNRAEFGFGWVIVRGRCDTREVVLERDSGAAAVDADGDGCRDDGSLVDLYTGQTIAARQAQADHVFSLAQAWYAGAWAWLPAQRLIFAQDQGNLRATLAAVNQSKGDDSPSEWRPPARSGWCGYATIFRTTAQRWQLAVSPADNAALDEMLGTCPGATR